MTQQHELDVRIEADHGVQGSGEVAPHSRPSGELSPRGRRERGMVTIEYAVGAVMVIALVAAIIVAIGQGWMGELSRGFAQFIFDQFKRALQLG